MGYVELTHPARTNVSAKTALGWLLPLAIAAAAVAWQLRLGANSDVSWLLMVADRLADGRRDFIEFNAPVPSSPTFRPYGSPGLRAFRPRRPATSWS
jgi:hypothetical protein